MQRLELKTAIAADDAGTITGTAWPFGTPDRVGDVIVKGAFAGSPAALPMLAFHDPNDPVGVWDEVRETDKGLEVKGRLLIGEVARAREIHALVKSGAVGGLSIGFVTRKSAPRKGGRTISALDILECSLVTIPSHPGARVTSAKSAADAIRLAEIINTASAALRAKEAH
jgi:HK97 family phage prohead protease